MSTQFGCCQTIWQGGPPTGSQTNDAVADGPASQLVYSAATAPRLFLEVVFTLGIIVISPPDSSTF